MKIILLGLLLSTIAFGAAKIQNADIKSNAAIDATKIHDGTISNTEFGYLNGVTSNIQTQLGSALTNPMTTAADLIYGGVGGAPTRLPVGSNGQCLIVSGGAVTWGACSAFSSPLTTKGDIFTYAAADARLPVGTNGQVLSANSAQSTGLEWVSNIGGNAGTATALAANPSDCGAGTKATAIDASGNLTCSAVSLTADVSGALPVANGGSGQTSYTDGQLLIGNSTGNTLTKATLTAGANITITNGNGSISIASTGGGGGSSVIDAMIYVDSATGYGSTYNKIRTYGRKVKDTGGAYVSYTSDTTNGDYFTVGTAGMYGICAGDYRNDVIGLGITVDETLASTGSTDIASPLTYAQGLRALYTGASAGHNAQVCDITDLNASQVVRIHTNGLHSGTDSTTYAYIVYLGAQSGKEFYVDGSAGYGSTNTKIRQFSSVRLNTGSYTHTTSGTNGDTIAVPDNGLYFVCRRDQRSSVGVMALAVTVNAGASVGSDGYNLTYAQGRRFTGWNGPGYYTQTGDMCGVLNLTAGDELRGHDAAGALANETNAKVSFKIIKLSSTQTAVYADTGSGYGSIYTKFRKLGNIRDYGDRSLIYGVSSISGSNMLANSEGMYIGCVQDYGGSIISQGVLMNPNQETTNISTPLDYTEGFRGFIKNASTNSGGNACSIGILPRGGKMNFGGDATSTATDAWINFNAAKIN